MSTAGMIMVSAGCPTFDGTDYPWKNKMRMHLEAIDIDLWYVVENGVPKAGEGVTAADVKKFVQLDSIAKNIICGHLTKRTVWPCECFEDIQASLGLALQSQRRRLNPERSENQCPSQPLQPLQEK